MIGSDYYGGTKFMAFAAFFEGARCAIGAAPKVDRDGTKIYCVEVLDPEGYGVEIEGYNLQDLQAKVFAELQRFYPMAGEFTLCADYVLTYEDAIDGSHPLLFDMPRTRLREAARLIAEVVVDFAEFPADRA